MIKIAVIYGVISQLKYLIVPIDAISKLSA